MSDPTLKERGFDGCEPDRPCACVDRCLRQASSPVPAPEETPAKICQSVATCLGCQKAIRWCREVYRCADCTLPFHRDCLRQHFGGDQTAEVSRLRSQVQRMEADQLTPEDARYCLENPPYHGFKHDLYAKLVRLRSGRRLSSGDSDTGDTE